MGYKLLVDTVGRIIEIRASGLLNQVLRKEILDTIARELSSNAFDKALLDLTETSINPAEPVSGAFELIDYMKSIGITPDTKLAFISIGAEYHRNYFEEFARRGGFSIRYFKNRDDALGWLGQTVPSAS